MKKMIRVSAALISAAAVMATAAPASADFHAYRDADFRGTHWQFAGPLNTLINLGPSNDEITSFKNWRTGSTYFTKNYPLYSWDPLILCQRANSSSANLNNNRWQNSTNVNDSISGIQLSSGNPC